MKRIITGILALVALLALGGCGDQAPEQMGRDEYLVYKGNLKYDVFSKMAGKDYIITSYGYRDTWYEYRGWNGGDPLNIRTDEWETKRGLRNRKDGIGEVIFLYGDEKAGYIEDQQCDISDSDVVLSEWVEANPSHRDHISHIVFETVVQNPYHNDEKTEAKYELRINFYKRTVLLNLSETFSTQKGKE